MSKTKKRIKKALKMAVPIIGAAMAGKALMGRRNRNRQMNEYLSTEGGDKSSILGPLQDNSFLPSDGFVTDVNPFGAGGAKKGGSAGRKKRSTITGVAVRGFGRALRGKK
jgi:hypothetical protein